MAVTLHFDVLFSSEPNYPLATLDNGELVAPELASFRDVCLIHRASGPAMNAEPSGRELTAGTLAFPLAASRLRSVMKVTMRLKAPSAPPAEYIRATATIEPDVTLDLRMASRPERGYLFVAAYVNTAIDKPQTDSVFQCYSVRCVRLAPTDDVRQVVGDAIRDEVLDAAERRRTPERPFIGLLPPLLARLTMTVGTAAAVRRWAIEPGHRLEVAAARECLRGLFDTPRLPRGRRVSMTPAEVTSRYVSLVPLFEGLLAAIPTKRWPAFHSLTGARDFVAKHLKAPEQDVRRIATLLRSGHRRPSAHHLAMRLLSEERSVSPRRLREVVRR